MTELDQLISQINETKDFIELINNIKDIIRTDCDSINESPLHQKCLTCSEPQGPRCFTSLMTLTIKLIATKPKLLDDNIKSRLVMCFKDKKAKAKNLISIENLSMLQKDGSQLLKWIKFESLLIMLIKEQIYEPKTMANEVLTIVKDELNPDLASKLASVVNECVKYCRESSKGNTDEEEEEKWCEIIDWLSWFLGSNDNEFP